MVEIDVKKSEVDEIRRSNLWQLIAPQSTVLDCSIATVLWFAARGSGTIAGNSPYTSPARVLFSGLGADELLGGYSRHRTKFQNGGEKRLEEEMKMDLRRIGNRNCGRDDRVISDHGREARYPFLDESVVAFLMSLPVKSRCRLDLQRGLGEKILLRLLLRHLGLGNFALLEKRAMQFGSRIAKIDQTKNGSDIISPLLPTIQDGLSASQISPKMSN
jgi:asparagine synthetase B (glutamine-hydrolysing)